MPCAQGCRTHGGMDEEASCTPQQQCRVCVWGIFRLRPSAWALGPWSREQHGEQRAVDAKVKRICANKKTKVEIRPFKFHVSIFGVVRSHLRRPPAAPGLFLRPGEYRPRCTGRLFVTLTKTTARQSGVQEATRSQVSRRGRLPSLSADAVPVPRALVFSILDKPETTILRITMGYNPRFTAIHLRMCHDLVM